MAGNTFGKIFQVTTFGESHGELIGVVIDGCPAGLQIGVEFIQHELDRRRPGQSKITTQRKESDRVRIVSGVYEGKSTGAPIAALIPNEDQRSKDYDHLSAAFRPSHADYTYQTKYGHRDPRGGGRSSARETAARVVAGAIAKLLLRESGIEISAYVSQVGGILLGKKTAELDLSLTETNIVRCPDAAVAAEMIALIDEVRSDGDTIGGVISAVIRGCPVGLGEPVFDRLHADLGKAMLSINAVKGFEIGSGFKGVEKRGSEHNDPFTGEGTQLRTSKNDSGGIQGGISNGMDIEFRVAFKPVATLMKPQLSKNQAGDDVTIEGKGRHDPCVVPRAVPIVEAMAAIVIADHLLRDRKYEGHEMIQVAIQGFKASFHDVAARTWFGSQEIALIECASFKSLALSLESREADLAVMAIENTIAGSILPNYGLLETYGFKIIGETYLRIEHSLMALPGQKLEDLSVVLSHPMALAQCDEFFLRNPKLRAQEAADTAGSARDIRDRGLRGYGAIASHLAAEVYGLDLLERGIETDKRNYTRFLVICRGQDHEAHRPQKIRAGKTSLRFQASHRPGSLAEVLAIFARNGVNLTKIQSVPILGRPYQYSFHLDLEWDRPEGYEEAMRALPGSVTELIRFGEYSRGERPELS